MPSKRYRWMVVPLVAPAVLAACGGSGSHSRAAAAATRPPAPTSTATTTTLPAPASTQETTTTAPAPSTTHPTSPPTTAPPPTFTDTVSSVTAADLPYSWRPGCPVAPSALRMIHMTYWGFDGRPHTGAMVVNAAVVDGVVQVFQRLYVQRFPISQMVPVDTYHGDDNAAAAADDTSGFNCRNAVAPGPPQWSVHAYGEAIDVNDVQNPYVDGSTIIPPSGAAYLNRSDVRPGMAVPGGQLVEAFASVGWQWGGRWSPGTDYQHFSLTGG